MGNLYAETRQSTSLSSNTIKEAAALLASCKEFTAKWLHVSPEVYVKTINQALANIRTYAPEVYKKNASEFSFDKVLSNDQIANLSEWRNLILQDPEFRKRMDVFVKNGLVLPKNYETFVEDHATLAALVMVQHAENFKGKIDGVGFSGQMAHICDDTLCVTFNIMEEMKKIAPQLFGAASKVGESLKPLSSALGTSTSPVSLASVSNPRPDAEVPGRLFSEHPDGTMVSTNGTPFVLAAVEVIGKKFTNVSKKRCEEIFGKGTYGKILKDVLPMMYKAYLKHNFNIDLPSFIEPANVAGQNIIAQNTSEFTKSTKESAYKQSNEFLNDWNDKRGGST
jgi:hypothetical protein